MNDRPLITRFLDGRPEAVDEIRRWIRGALRPYRQRLIEDLEDLEQEVLYELDDALKKDRFSARSRLRTYVSSFTHHKCIDRLRSKKRRTWVSTEDLELTANEPSPLERVVSRDTIELVNLVLREVPEECRELWEMLQEGMRYGEMSRRLGVPEATLRSRVLRCRRRALEVRKRVLMERTGGEVRS